MTEETTPQKSKAQVLTDVYSLATLFSTCVEAFNLIHPSKESDQSQKIALAKLGLQQGRLLIFGDAVGIAAPPPTIAKHMIPSHPGLTNPDPHLPVNFGVRDAKLDDEVVNNKIRKALNEISGRPGNLSRDELMDKYGLKSPKHFSRLEYPALDTNRLEGFREKYALLQDLVRQMGARASMKRNMSMTTNHWTVKNSVRFDQFVKSVRLEVDALIDLMGVKEQVDRGTRSDIRCMAWHPDLSGPVVKHDWEKLRLIRHACEVDYPEYIEVVDSALQYINEELKETMYANRRASYALGTEPLGAAAGARRKSDYDIRTAPPEVQAEAKEPAKVSDKTHIQLAAERALDPNVGREKRPSVFGRLKSWSKGRKGETGDKQRSKSVPHGEDGGDPQRSLSAAAGEQDRSSEEMNNLEPIRSKSLSAIPDAPAPLNLDSRMRDLAINEQGRTAIPATVPEDREVSPGAPVSRIPVDMEKNNLLQTDTVSSEGSGGTNGLYGATTVNSLIDRHDMYKGMGRIETKDIRATAHEFGG